MQPELTLPVLDPNRAAFPAADLVDFAPTLDPPAGKHGFLFAGSDGHFYFENGRRGRFWGINVAKDAVFVPKEVIDQVAGRLAGAGFNLVRLHHIDGVAGLLPPDRASSEDRVDPGKLDAVHYWVHALKERGIYTYLDLLDFRTFQEEEGVPHASALGRGAKPAAVFNERLIELQLSYARKLLFDQPNPYTGVALGADPAVVMVEICDENGLFAKPERWEEMPDVYAAELRKRWNFWLRGTYGSTEALSRAWAEPGGASALAAGERLEDSSVRLLPSGSRDTVFPSPTGGSAWGVAGTARRRDVARFCHSVHREYFAQMKRALRESGLRAPLTAVTDWDHPADLRAVVDELDFVGCNWYYDHPVFGAGLAWRLPSFFANTSPIGDQDGLDFTCSVLRASVAGRPLVVREWGACWPSKFRGAGMVETAAYGALQDIDALILFTYSADPDNRRIEYFDVSSDPVRWGLVGVSGAIYRFRAVRPARKRAVVGSSRGSSFVSAPTPHQLFRLGWRCQLRQYLFEETCPADSYDLVVAPGESGPASYPGRRVLFHLRSSPQTGAEALLQSSGYAVLPRPAAEGRFVFDGLIYDAGRALDLAAGLRFATDEVHAAGYEAVGVSEDGTSACGFWDPRRENCILAGVGLSALVRAATDLTADDAEEGAVGRIHAAMDRAEYGSDTGEIRRLAEEERLVLDAPRVQALVGALGPAPVRMSDVTVSSSSPLGVVVALSLNEQPLSDSDAFLVKMVTVAANQGEKKSLRDAPPGSPRLKLEAFGSGPVDTRGQPTSAPTTIELRGQPLLWAFLTNGTWEAVRTRRGWYLWCDTPGARFDIPELGTSVRLTPFDTDGMGEEATISQPFAYAERWLFVRVQPSEP